MSVRSRSVRKPLHAPCVQFLAWLLVPVLAALLVSPLAAQHRAVPSQTPVLLLGHSEPEGAGCGQWGQLTVSACAGKGECRPDSLSADDSIKLYDRLDAHIDTLVAEVCEARDCPGFEFRNDSNHIDCRAADTCMQRSLVYRCMGAAQAPEAPPTRGSRTQPAASTMAIDAREAGLAMAAASPEVDLTFSGPLSLGGKTIEWGNVIKLRRADAEAVENGRCRFRYRFSAINRGDNPAGAHVNRVRLGEHVLLAEHAVDGIEPGRRSNHSGLVTLWSGEITLFAFLDDEQQLNDIDRTNNLRRVRVELAEGCADPRPQARAPGGTSTRHIPRPTGRHAPPEPESTGSRAPTTAPPPPSGSRAAPPPRGKPAPGTEPKPVPADAGDCRPMLSATRVTGLTRTGARTTAIAAWEASAIAMYGSGFRWDSARDQSTECSVQIGWTCTVRARPCRN